MNADRQGAGANGRSDQLEYNGRAMTAPSGTSWTDSTIERSRGGQLDALVCDLRSRIHSGELLPGERLVEADLVGLTGKSRGRVRDALRVLEMEGLVEINRNRGACVRRITRSEVRDTMEVIRAISVLMCDKAIDNRHDPVAAATLTQAMDDARRFRDHMPQQRHSRTFMEENARFWRVFAEMSGNPVLMDTRMRLETTLFRLSLEGAQITTSRQQWIMRHEEILEAVIAGDRGRARGLVEVSVAEVEEAMLALPDSAYL